MIRRAQPALEEEPAAADQELVKKVELAVQGDRLGAAELEIDFQVVLQVLADAGQLVHNGDAGVPQHLAGPNAGELKQHGRADRAGAKNNLPLGPHGLASPACLVVDADRLQALEHHPPGQRVRGHLEVRPPQRRLQIGRRRGAAHAALDGHVHRPEAFLLEAVVVVGRQISRLLPRLYEGPVERVFHLVAVAGAERPAAAAVVVGAGFPGLGPAEIGQAASIAPA